MNRPFRRRVAGVATAVAVTAGAGVGVASAVSTSGGHRSAQPAPAAAPGPETIPLEQGRVLADAATTTPGSTVAGISCEASEQVAYHVHAHLAVYVNGSSRPIPAGIGVVSPILQHTPAGDFAQASRCYYWLHTHAQDGVVHIESPSLATYTLGQFFAGNGANPEQSGGRRCGRSCDGVRERQALHRGSGRHPPQRSCGDPAGRRNRGGAAAGRLGGFPSVSSGRLPA